jgi:hypothetical protein
VDIPGSPFLNLVVSFGVSVARRRPSPERQAARAESTTGQRNLRPFAMEHPETAWALLEAMVQRVRDAEAR